MVRQRVEVKRVNVLSRSGRALAGRLQVDLVPLILLYDLHGVECYRASGFAVRPAAVARMIDSLIDQADRSNMPEITC